MSVKGCTAKQVQIIADSGLEPRIIKRLNKVGIANYTVFDARGEGDSGWHSGQMDGDSEVLILLLLDENQMDSLKDVCKHYLSRGHHLTVFVSNVEMISLSCM